MHKANGSASHNYTPSLRVYHPRGVVTAPRLGAGRGSTTRLCERCGRGIYGEKKGRRTLHDECKTEDELKQASKRAAWKAAWRERQKQELAEAERLGRKPSEALDATKPLAQPLLVVSRPLSLAMVAHQYVASVMIECDGDKTKARKTLGISIGGLNRYLARIESGEIGKEQLHVRNSTRRDAGNGKARKTVQPMLATEQDEGLPGVRNAG